MKGNYYNKEAQMYFHKKKENLSNYNCTNEKVKWIRKHKIYTEENLI